jgi:hypothetical protein
MIEFKEPKVKTQQAKLGPMPKGIEASWVQYKPQLQANPSIKWSVQGANKRRPGGQVGEA